MAIVYEHLRNDTNEVFYVGIGEYEKRAYCKYNRNPYWHNIVNKHGYTINIIHTDISWKDACEIEKELIAKYGRKNLGLGNLVNCTDGGDGILGLVHSEETRQKMSEARKGEKNHMFGKTHSEETRQKLSEAGRGEKHRMFGKTHSEETRNKISEAQKGKTHSKESRQKMSEARKGEKHYLFGKTHSKESRQKISEAQKGEKNHMFGKTHSEETRNKISEAQKGKTHSEETKQKISEARIKFLGQKRYTSALAKPKKKQLKHTKMQN
jgi:group I intron endonuclease